MAHPFILPCSLAIAPAVVTQDDAPLDAMPAPRASQAVYERGPLSAWQQMGISREFIDKAFRSAPCEGAFKVQYIGGQLYSCDAWPDPRKGFPHTLFYTRRLHVMKLLHDAFLSTRSVPTADSVAIGDWEAVFCLGDCVASQLPFARERHIGSTYQLAPDPVAAFVPVSCPGSMNILKWRAGPGQRVSRGDPSQSQPNVPNPCPGGVPGASGASRRRFFRLRDAVSRSQPIP